MKNLHWVNSPQYQGEGPNGCEEIAGLGIFRHCHCASVERKLIDDDEEGETSHGIVSPFLAILCAQGSKQTGQNHDNVGNNSYKNVGTVQAS